MRSVNQEVKFIADDYEQLVVRARIRTDSLKGRVGLLSVVYNQASKLRYVYASEGNEITKVTDWTNYEMPVVVEPGRNTIILAGHITGDGIAWFDNFELVEKEKVLGASSQEVVKYVDQFITIVQENALHKDTLNFDELKSGLQKLTSHAQSREDCYAPFRYAVKWLNDRHSQFFDSRMAQAWSTPAKGSPGIEYAAGRIIEGVAYMEIPGFGSGEPRLGNLYADSLQRLIEKLDRQGPIGWIVDLRKNSGGNCWPVLAGLGPLLGGGVCGYFYANGKYGKPWNYESGSIREGRSKYLSVSKPYRLKEEAKRIVVLQNERTVSSGEIVAIAFIGKPNAKSMGFPSGGLTTNNSMFKMSDGAIVNLTTSVYADRNKKIYGSRIVPDTVLEKTDDFIGKAIGWIKNN